MSHVRTQIRTAAVTALASLGGVHASRVYPIQPEELPVYLVYTTAETADYGGEFGSMSALERRLQLVIEVVASAQDIDLALDNGMVRVEALIGADITLGGLCAQCLLGNIEITTSVEGSAPIGRARMTYEAVYRTSIVNPETAL
jgi:hypothetical protein